MGSNDALFVMPEYRSTMVPGRLIKLAEAEAAKRGATHFYWHTRAGTPLAETLERHGYTPADVVVMRKL
jgi:GNAT superfamily N-acetyltransferase